MAVPSSGPISLLGIQREIHNNDYNATNTHTNVTLADLSTGQDEDINTDNAAADRPDGVAPHSMSEFYNYDHDLVTETILHSTSFQPEKRTYVVPYQPIYHISGFTTSLLSRDNAPTNLGSVSSQGTFTLGGKTGVNIAGIYNHNNDNNSTNGEKIIVQFHHASGTNFSNSGWTSLRIYANSNGSGSPLITLNRTAASSYDSTIQNSSNVRLTYTYTASRAFSSYFGTSTTPSSNTTHFIEIVE
jgi:hypothetical protein